MLILTDPSEMQRSAMGLRRNGLKLALVPTMGCLHEGHLSLVREAARRADRVIVSLFVNPAQFGPGEDFARYPRPFEHDAALCRGAGVHILFAPAPEDMYAPDASVFVDEGRISRGLCGSSRPGHFKGVLTVVTKLFNLCRPDLAVFGRKDAQQARLIRQMARDLNFPVEIVVAPTVREGDGLAMSSRNRYLSGPDRKKATCLHSALQAARAAFEAGERGGAALKAIIGRRIAETPGAAVEYVEIVDAESFEPAAVVRRPALAALAVRLGATRLIDNIELTPEPQAEGAPPPPEDRAGTL
ncbi:MAG: pantoate--beta-alanine ligase [Lentisphaerae bacterium]|nr:pantoate--beta-alanine ligase [Lentisphaerota bacterium]